MNIHSKNTIPNRRFPSSAIIMAGGQSRRMGTDKTLLPMGQISLIEYVIRQIEPFFEEILISANEASRFENLPYCVVPDYTRGKGPIVGLITAIQSARYDTCFVQACDIPRTDIPLIEKMLSLVTNHDAVVPKTHEGYYEPLFAVYRKSAIPAMKRILEKENGRCSLIPERCNSIVVELDETQNLRNMNTPADYTDFLQSMKSGNS